MILITGSAGKTGRAIIQALMNRQESIRAIVHRADQISIIKALGVDDVQVGELNDLTAMSRAMRGVTVIYHIAPNVHPDEVTIGKTMLRAARFGNVEHFVFHSVLHPQVEAMPHHWKKSRVEELIFESGLEFSILQPAIYMQNILAQWDQITAEGIYRLPYGSATRLCQVDLEDVAEAAAIILTEPGHRGAIYELVGTPAMTQIEVVNVLSEQLNCRVDINEIGIEVWERTARASGLGDYQVSTLIKMFGYYERFGFLGNVNTLRSLLGRKPNSFVDFIQRIKKERDEHVRKN